MFSSPGAARLSSLLDTDVSSRSDGDEIAWDATAGKWVDRLPSVVYASTPPSDPPIGTIWVSSSGKRLEDL